MSQQPSSSSDDDAPNEQREQHAADDGSALQPKGEYRTGSTDPFVVSRSGDLSGTLPARRSGLLHGGTTDTEADIESVPADAKHAYEDYYLTFTIAQSALKTFDDLVTEPDWAVEATIDGETDEEMTDALDLWGHNCTIRAGEPGHDIATILAQAPSGRRAKPAVLVEKIGTTDDPDAIAALQLLEPWDMSARLRANQNLLMQPGDPIPPDHPTVKVDGETIPAAYVQYDEETSRFGTAGATEAHPIPFAASDLLKLTYEPPDGSAWGRTIWTALAEPIDALKQKLRDRNASIRLVGHPHRIYSSDSWTREQAQDYANAHDTGQTSAWDDDVDDGDGGYAGRIDYVPNTVNVEVVEGEVADISEAVKDDLEQIFAMLPVGQHNIAYVENINQFVVEPLDQNDNRAVDKERRYLESEFTDLFAEKADELAEGEYSGEVAFKIRQPESDNPLDRSEFDPDRVASLVRAFTEFVTSGASTEFPRELPYFLSGMDRESFEAEYGDVDPDEFAADSDDADTDESSDELTEDDDDEIDADNPDVQEAAEQMGIGSETADAIIDKS